MRDQLRPAFVTLLLLTLAIGVVYLLAITAIGQETFPHQADSSLSRIKLIDTILVLLNVA